MVNIPHWTMAHGTLLTLENIWKRDIEGPSQCSLFPITKDSSKHLLLECRVIFQDWKLTFIEKGHVIVLPTS
jgi:hypothetical protein